MRIQLITRKYVPAPGGAERSIHNLVLYARLQGHSVQEVVQANRKYEGRGSSGEIRTVRSESEIPVAMSDFEPDVVFTQIDWNKTAVENAREKLIPVVHFSRVGDANLAADLIVFNSDFVRKAWLSQRPELEKRSLTLYPTILPDQLGPPLTTGAAILCINPVRAKGGELVARIAAMMPNRQFIATRGWCDPAVDGVDFSSMPNVLLVPPRDGIASFCAQSFTLLMPSLWDEPFGRVVVEAMSHGLPVIACNRGGISEAMGGAGILLARNAGVSEWVDAITRLAASPELFRMEREKALTRANRYWQECDPEFLLSRISELVEHYRGPVVVEGPPADDANTEWFLHLEEK